VTSKYPGCRERVEDGVRYVQVGLAAGYFGSMLTYFLALPLALRRYPSDLVVEDFAAPFSSVLVPWWTRRPVVGVVQWLFARQKSRQYKLPFFVVEALGVRAHRRMVAVSSELASQLRGRNGRARVDVVHNGVAPELLATRADKGTDLVFLGRVEIAQKGLDMLLEAFASVAGQTDARLVVAGDGPDVAAVRERIRSLGLEGRVELVCRVEGEAKRALLASAQLVCMPSRYETFGMVAAEAMACGTPVLAFDIPCLREVLPTECGVLVPAFDVGAFATALAELAGDADRCAAMGDAGRDAARRFDWQRLARRQEDVYLDAVRERAGGPPPAAPASSAVLGPALAGLCRPHRGRVLLFGNYGKTNSGFAYRSAPAPPTSGPGLADPTGRIDVINDSAPESACQCDWLDENRRHAGRGDPRGDPGLRKPRAGRGDGSSGVRRPVRRRGGNPGAVPPRPRSLRGPTQLGFAGPCRPAGGTSRRRA
jgi:glycosyltransferase involved in cell wall biosynthesis